MVNQPLPSEAPPPSAPADGPEERLARVGAVAAAVPDPELPMLTIADLGILREVRLAADGQVEVVVTPTYSGCPAMRVIVLDLERALEEAGCGRPRIVMALAPAWTTDWLSEDGRAKLRAAGIAPPACRAALPVPFAAVAVACPRCASEDTERLAEFGATPCKALYRCRSCREPFEYFKCL